MRDERCTFNGIPDCWYLLGLNGRSFLCYFMYVSKELVSEKNNRDNIFFLLLYYPFQSRRVESFAGYVSCHIVGFQQISIKRMRWVNE